MNRLRTWASVCAMVVLCASPTQATVVIDTVPVGDPGNAGELSGWGAGGYGSDCICGAVDYTYDIGKYEVTAGQYAEFLNAVAATDTHGLYNPQMWSVTVGSPGCRIQRSGSPGTYTYSVAPGWANRPANWVDWGDAARFANWLHNGQPNGLQNLSTTEDGSYFLVDTSLLAVQREPDATWVIPTEDEWYKAAYYKGGGTDAGYWEYPTQSDAPPTSEPPPGTDLSNGSANRREAANDLVDDTEYTTDVGAYDAKPSDSPYGTFDQGGNVYEWNETYLTTFGRPYRGLRGGSFYLGHDHMRADYRGFGAIPWYDHATSGFRVGMVPEPTTLVILALASTLVLRRRRYGAGPR